MLQVLGIVLGWRHVHLFFSVFRMPRSRSAVKRNKTKVVRVNVKKKSRSMKEAVVGK